MSPQNPEHGAFAQGIGLHQLSHRGAIDVCSNQSLDCMESKPTFSVLNMTRLPNRGSSNTGQIE